MLLFMCHVFIYNYSVLNTLCSGITLSGLSKKKKKAYLPLSSLLHFLHKIHYYLTF